MVRRRSTVPISLSYTTPTLSRPAGGSWGSRPSPVTTALYALSMGSSTVGYAVGAGGVVLRSGNGGLTWARRTTGLPASTTLRSVFAKVHPLHRTVSDGNSEW
jgi:photosystem II stability/assembly factor-like uncharacterized protein